MMAGDRSTPMTRALQADGDAGLSPLPAGLPPEGEPSQPVGAI
jgi:hypothetical protein